MTLAAHSTAATDTTRPVEILGMIATQDGSETRGFGGPAIDLDYTVRFAQAHEEAGFDRVLIGYGSSSPDGNQVAAYVAANTDRLGLLIAHRPGFVAPTLASRTFATLDQFSRGRVALNVITGGSDVEQRRDGDYLTHDERYERTDEYLGILRRAWSSHEPFSHSGRHYSFEDYAAGVLPYEDRYLELFFGGSSAAAYRVGGNRADTYMLWGEPLAQTAEQIASVRAAAEAAGRPAPRISVSLRPIVGATEESAWERAHGILDTIRKGPVAGYLKRFKGGGAPQNVGSQRLLAVAEKGDLHDRALWTAPAAASGAAGNSTAVVGSAETVAAALLDYVEIGVDTILIRGYDPLEDAVEWGKEVIPMVREGARRLRPEAYA